MFERPISGRVKVGIVGLGRIFDLHALGYVGQTDADVVALCDLSEERRRQRSAAWADATVYDDIEQFLEADLDVVDVLVPTPLHGSVVCAALRAGHHVNVQKPMARTLAEADEMIAAAQQSGVVLRVMENYLFYEPLIRLRNIVRSGELGEPVGYAMKMVGTGVGGWDVPFETWKWQMDEVAAGRGILAFDDGWHKFSVARWLFGPVTDVMGWIGATDLGAGYVMDAPSTVMWNHTNGIRGVFDMTLAPDMRMESDYYSNDERFEVTCREGFVRVNHCTAHGLRQPALEVYRDGELRQFHVLDEDWASSFRDSTCHFIRYLRGEEDDPLWSADDARAVLQLTLAAHESSEVNHPVTLD